jgi:hypothetical protein
MQPGDKKRAVLNKQQSVFFHPVVETEANPLHHNINFIKNTSKVGKPQGNFVNSPCS